MSFADNLRAAMECLLLGLVLFIGIVAGIETLRRKK